MPQNFQNTIELNNINIAGGNSTTQQVIYQVFLTEKLTGNIVYMSSPNLYTPSFGFQVGSYPFDVEIRIILGS